MHISLMFIIHQANKLRENKHSNEVLHTGKNAQQKEVFCVRDNTYSIKHKHKQLSLATYTFTYMLLYIAACFPPILSWSRNSQQIKSNCDYLKWFKWQHHCKVHYKARFPLPEFTGRVDGPWTRVVETGLKSVKQRRITGTEKSSVNAEMTTKLSSRSRLRSAF